MQTVDWIVLFVLIIGALIGLILGFGKLLKIFTGGIIGFIISLVVVYFCIGFVSSWGFVQDLMDKLVQAMESANNGFVNWLIGIKIEKVLLGIILFIVVQLLRILIVSIIKEIVEIDNAVMKTINKVFGVIFMLVIIAMVALIVFQIVAWVGGDSAVNFEQSLTGAFHIDAVFRNNPLNALFR